MRVKLLAMFFLIFHCICGTELFSETLPNVLIPHLNPKGIDVAKMKQINTNWSSIEKDERSYDVAEIDSNKQSELTNQTDFECCICYHSRFVSLKPNCGHEICAVCFIKIFAMDSLKNKCALCRMDLTNNPDDYKANYHRISDLESDEYNAAAIIAAVDDKIEILKFLAKEKVYLNGDNEYGINPIFFAVQKGNTEIIRFLAEEKVDLNRATIHGVTPILIAAAEGHAETVRILAEEKVDLNRARDNGVTPVWIAAHKGHTKIVRILAEEKVDLNRAADNGFTPIMIAAENGHTEIVKFLIQSNVNVGKSLLSLETTKEIKEIITKALDKN